MTAAITVTSEPGKGTRFCVYFPVVDGEVTGKHQQVVEAFHGNGERVLFLDDEEPIVLLASRMLNRLGYKVEAHTRASEALEEFRRRPAEFDLVLTDLSMPGASGMDFARSVLAIRPEVPVIMTTGYIDPDDLDLARAHRRARGDPEAYDDRGDGPLIPPPAQCAAESLKVASARRRSRAPLPQIRNLHRGANGRGVHGAREDEALGLIAAHCRQAQLSSGSVSTPSASTSMPSEWPSEITALTIVVL